MMLLGYSLGFTFRPRGSVYKVSAGELSRVLQKRIESFYLKLAIDEVGKVLSIGDGIARVYGRAG